MSKFDFEMQDLLTKEKGLLAVLKEDDNTKEDIAYFQSKLDEVQASIKDRQNYFKEVSNG